MSNLEWINEAEAMLGVTEIPGSRSHPEIMKWAKELGSKYYTTDSIPWCALFAAHCLHTAKVDLKPVGNILWAYDYAKLGVKVPPCYGAVMVCKSGHVAFLISQDRDYYHILGGNQGDKVSVIRTPKSNLMTARWPKEYFHLRNDDLPLNLSFTPG